MSGSSIAFTSHRKDMPENETATSASQKEGDYNSSELTMAVAITCVVLVAIDLRPAIVSIGPLLPAIWDKFTISNAQASLLTAIPALLMRLFTFPTPCLARRFGRDKVMLVALAILTFATLTRAFGDSVLTLRRNCGCGRGNCRC